jgi:hypothetical protein
MGIADLFRVGIADLFGPKWKNSDWRVRLAAVEKLTDQAILAQVAKSDPSRAVWTVAFEKLEDQTILVRIATSHPGWWRRLDAVEKLTDQAILA